MSDLVFYAGTVELPDRRFGTPLSYHVALRTNDDHVVRVKAGNQLRTLKHGSRNWNRAVFAAYQAAGLLRA